MGLLFRKQAKPLAPALLSWPREHGRWGLWRFLRSVDKSHFVEDEAYPDFCVFLPHDLPEGKTPWHYLGYKLFISGENTQGDEEFYDWGQTYAQRSSRNLRILPAMVMNPKLPSTILSRANTARTGCNDDDGDAAGAAHAAHCLRQKTKFCAFLQSNGDCATRNHFFEILARGARVDSCGTMLRNSTGPPRFGRDPIFAAARFYRPYKFVMNFENSLGYGYTTEKLWSAFYAQSVPIYWGNPLVGDLFNPERFINAHDFDSLESLARHVLRVHADDELYLRYLSAPIMTERQRESFFADEKRTRKFRDNVFAYIRKYPTSLTQRRVFSREILSRLSGKVCRSLDKTRAQSILASKALETSRAHVWPHCAFYDAMEMPSDALPED